MNEYEQQAQNFLKSTNTSLEVKLADPQHQPTHWGGNESAKHYEYRVTLSNERAVYTFSFWDSINQAEKLDALKLIANSGFSNYSSEYYRAQALLRKELNRNLSPILAKKKFDEYAALLAPSAYSVLACLDLVHDNNFEDWCSNYGYDTDSRNAEETYKLCLEQDRNLRRLFTIEELEQLQEIA